MGAWEIVLIVACSLLLVGVIVSLVIKKLKGKPVCDCGCDCAHCTGCIYCETAKKQEQKNNK